MNLTLETRNRLRRGALVKGVALARSSNFMVNDESKTEWSAELDLALYKQRVYGNDKSLIKLNVGSDEYVYLPKKAYQLIKDSPSAVENIATLVQLWDERESRIYHVLDLGQSTKTYSIASLLAQHWGWNKVHLNPQWLERIETIIHELRALLPNGSGRSYVLLAGLVDAIITDSCPQMIPIGRRKIGRDIPYTAYGLGLDAIARNYGDKCRKFLSELGWFRWPYKGIKTTTSTHTSGMEITTKGFQALVPILSRIQRKSQQIPSLISLRSYTNGRGTNPIDANGGLKPQASITLYRGAIAEVKGWLKRVFKSHSQAQISSKIGYLNPLIEALGREINHIRSYGIREVLKPTDSRGNAHNLQFTKMDNWCEISLSNWRKTLTILFTLSKTGTTHNMDELYRGEYAEYLRVFALHKNRGQQKAFSTIGHDFNLLSQLVLYRDDAGKTYLPVHYERCSSGRFHNTKRAGGALLQSLSTPTRKMLMEGQYDIDMNGAHMSIGFAELNRLIQEYSVGRTAKQMAPHLAAYVADVKAYRSDIAQDLNIPLANVKLALTMCTFGAAMQKYQLVEDANHHRCKVRSLMCQAVGSSHIEDFLDHKKVRGFKRDTELLSNLLALEIASQHKTRNAIGAQYPHYDELGFLKSKRGRRSNKALQAFSPLVKNYKLMGAKQRRKLMAYHLQGLEAMLLLNSINGLKLAKSCRINFLQHDGLTLGCANAVQAQRIVWQLEQICANMGYPVQFSCDRISLAEDLEQARNFLAD